MTRTAKIALWTLDVIAFLGAVWLCFIAAGCTTPAVPVPVTPPPVVSPPPVEVPPAPVLSKGDAQGPLHVCGVAFCDANGSPVTIRGASGFELFAKFANGIDIDPTLTDWIAQSHGKLNYVRVFGSYAGALGQFHGEGQAQGDYFVLLDAFLSHLAERNLYVEFTVFADAQNWLPAQADQQAWLDRVAPVLAQHDGMVFKELANEAEFNGVNPQAFAHPVGTLWSRGSAGGDAVPPAPAWDYVTSHGGRRVDWSRSVHCGGPDGFTASFHVPCIEDEPMGAAENPRPGARDTEPSHFFDAAAATVLQAAGFTVHSDAGITADVLGPVQAACFSAAFDAMGVIAPPFQLAGYQRGGLSGSQAPQIQHSDSLSSRTFSKELGNEAWDIAVLPQPAWMAVAVSPWRIDQVYGPHGELVHLVR